MPRGRLLSLGVGIVMLVAAAPAAATTITVNTNNDDQQQGDGQCSLRKAIADVNAPGSNQSDCAPAAFGANTIALGAHSYFLGGASQLTIAPTATVTIAGLGEGKTFINAQLLSNRVFDVSGGALVTLTNLTIANAHAPNGLNGSGAPGAAGQPGANGGAILNEGTLRMIDDAITGSQAGNGGAGANGASPSTGDGGAGGGGGLGGSGGAIYNAGSLSLNGVTIGSNDAGGGGGGGTGGQGVNGGSGGSGGAGGTGGAIANAGGTLTVLNSTIRSNGAGNGGAGGTGGAGSSATGGTGGSGSAGAGGGGISSNTGTLSVTNSTFASNTAGTGGNGGSGGAGSVTSGTGGNGGNGGAGGSGGGALVVAPQSASFVNTTVAGNNAGPAGAGGGAGPGNTAGSAGSPGSGGSAGGVLDQGSSTTLQNSLLALNAGGNCGGSILDGGLNLGSGDATCPSTFAGGDPNLGALQDNGGPAPTIALGRGSAAIDQIPATGAGCPATDERGVHRPSGLRCDIGAYEVAPPVAKTAAATAITTNAATLNGIVTPNAGAAGVVFQYGTSTKYGSTTKAQQVGGVAATPFSVKVSQLKPNTTYHYRLVAVAMDGTSYGGDTTFTTSVVPVISGLTVAPRSFRRARGATISYSDSKAATTTFAVLRCVKSKRQRCTRYASVGRFSHHDSAGRNKVHFTGRIGRLTLSAGPYVLDATPRTGAKVGKTVGTAFRILG